MAPGGATSSSRAQVVIGSPSTRWPAAPRAPSLTRALPVATATRVRAPALARPTAWRMASAARTARSGSSSWVRGRPKTASARPPTRCSITPPKRSTSACTRATSAATLRSTSSVTSLRSAWCWAAPPVAAGSASGRLWRFQKRSQRSNGSVVSRVTASPPGCARKRFGGALVERAAGSGWRAEWRGSAPDHLERAGCDAPDHLEWADGGGGQQGHDGDRGGGQVHLADDAVTRPVLGPVDRVPGKSPRAHEPCHVADGGEHDQHRAERREHEGLPSCPPASARYPRGPGHRADPKVMIKITLYQIKSKSHSMREKFRRAPLMDVHADAGLRHTS